MRRTEDLGANVTKELFTDVTINTFDGNSWKSLSRTHISKLSMSQLEVNHSILRLAGYRFILLKNR